MKVLVTGAAGFIGSVVTEVLVNEGHTVVGFDSLKYGHRAAVETRAEFVEGDLRNAPLLQELLSKHRFDAVVHLAAEAYIDVSIVDPGLFFDVNDVGGLYLLQAMALANCRGMVFSSTAAVYGDPVKVPIAEDHSKEPVNPYGETKLQFERMMTWFHKAHGLNHVSLRYFNACATKAHGEDRRKETHIIPILFEAVTGKRKKFTLFGTDYDTPDGTCVRDYVHVYDIAQAHLLALANLENLGEKAYNLGSGKGNSNLEVIETVKRVTQVDFPIENGERRPGDPAKLVATHDLIQKDLGWKPKFTDLEQMVRSSWEWRAAHPAGYGD